MSHIFLREITSFSCLFNFFWKLHIEDRLCGIIDIITSDIAFVNIWTTITQNGSRDCSPPPCILMRRSDHY